MPWCPNCKTEYEPHILECVECQIPLLDEEAFREEEKFELIGYVPHNPENVSAEIVAYLEYSKIEPIKQVEEGDRIGLYVHKSQKEEAYKYLKVYMREKTAAEIDDAEEELLLGEYETLNVDSSAKLKELNASAFSFALIGSLLLVFSALNLLGIMNILSRGTFLYVFLVLGVASLLVGVLTYRKIPQVKTDLGKLETHLQEILDWFESNYTNTSYLTKKEIDFTQFDEGSMFFVLADYLKKDLDKVFPDDSEVIINSGCELIFEKHFNHYEVPLEAPVEEE